MAGISTQSLNPFGFSPSGISANPFATPSSVFNSYATQSATPIFQLLQVVPQHIQQLQQLAYLQQQQLQQLQQIVQLIPAHLVQLQQQIQTQQPFGWGTSPQAFGTQPGYVM
ncbi:MAG: hypothetical protein ACRD1V_17375 [Vicinamibacterales bacterium]